MNKEQSQRINQELRTVRKKRYQNNSQQKQFIAQILQSGMEIDFKDPQLYKVLSKGIPSLYRNSIWPKIYKNTHGITYNYYKILLKKVQNIQKGTSRHSECSKQIDHIYRDIQRTFPELKIYIKGTQQYQSLFNVLSAWVMFREDIGYVQSMSQIAGFLLIQLKQLEAFQLFSSIITSDLLYSYFTFDMDSIKRIQFQFQHKFRIIDQQFYYRLKDNQIDTRIYLINWVMTMFTRCLEVDLLGRVWDLMFLNQYSQDFLIEICISVILSLKQEIQNQYQPEDMVKILKTGKIKQIKQDDFFNRLQQFQRRY